MSYFDALIAGAVDFLKSEKGDAPYGSIAHFRKKVAIPTRQDGQL